MSAHAREIMQGVLSLRREWLTAASGLDVTAGGDAAGTLERIVGTLATQARGGDAAARAALDLMHRPAGTAAGGAADPAEGDPEIGREDTAAAVVAAAGRAMAAGDVGGAARRAALLVGSEETAAEGYLALAAIAIETGAHDDAAELAERALKLAPGHPRAHCLLGYGTFVRGNAKAAQYHLATATRLARRRPELRGDQRAAQQLLLLLHLT